MSKISKAIIAVTLALSIGAQWPLLQSIAWLNMLVTYSAQEGLEQAVSKTFDGNHPCKLCRFVAEGKKAEKENGKQIVIKKMDLILVMATPVRFDCDPFIAHPAFDESSALRFYPPTGPPPDAA